MTNEHPTDPNAETVGLPNDDSGKGSMPEPGKFATTGMPSEIGRYKILSVIASGGMGVVYEAMQEAPRRRVALKVIKAGAVSEMALHRFHFESQVLAKLNHPNIAKIYEAGTWESDSGEVPFFAMEYIPGAQGLVSYAQKRDLPIRDRLQLFRHVCDAVHHGHQKGVIHRDLKPDNILIDSNGDPKIIDFGVARATDADLAITTMQTTMGQLIGTLQYMSPEQCDANPDLIDTRSDVYALGVILFQLLSGKLPYDLRKQAIHEAVRVIKEERPTSMGATNSTLRGDIDTITSKAMEKDSDHRYQSAAEFANDILRFLNNEPIIARPLSIGYQVRLFTKKYKRTCAAVVLLAVSVVLGTLGTTWGMVEANRQRQQVVARNIILENTVKSLLGGVKDVVQDLGNSAEAQRALLDLARTNLNAMQDGRESTPREKVELAEILLRSARSHLSLTGVGFGNVDDAVNALEQAEQVLLGIDLSSTDTALTGGVTIMLLDQKKYLAEAVHVRAELETDVNIRISLLKQTAEIYRTREKAGKSYHKKTGNVKGIDVQKSSLQGLGNVLLELGDTDGALRAFEDALVHAESLVVLEPSKSLRRQRGVAITLYSIANLINEQEPTVALKYLKRAVAISRTALSIQNTHARRPRDLAIMLALRGEIRVQHGIDVQAGIDDCREAATLLTRRAVESPREMATQQDVELYITQIVDTLEQAAQYKVGSEILTSIINQLDCIASAEELAGRTVWTEILNRLQDRSDAFATVPTP